MLIWQGGGHLASASKLSYAEGDKLLEVAFVGPFQPLNERICMTSLQK